MNEEVTPSALLRIDDHDRQRLGEALRVLLHNGSILGLESAHSDLYHWAWANRPWLEEMAKLFDFQLYWENEMRLVQAIPGPGTFLLRLKLDATLVLLTLWYEFDSAVRDRGESPPVILTVEELNAALETKFEPIRKARPSQTRMIEILRLVQRKNLVRFTPAAEFAQSRIAILPTIKRVIPFQSLDDWTRRAARFTAGSAEEESVTDDDSDAEN
jgi:hypothetical protein